MKTWEAQDIWGTQKASLSSGWVEAGCVVREGFLEEVTAELRCQEQESVRAKQRQEEHFQPCPQMLHVLNCVD